MERNQWATPMASSDVTGANQFGLKGLLIFIALLADFCSLLSCHFELIREVVEDRRPRGEHWHKTSAAEYKQLWQENHERNNARRFRTNAAVAANGLLAGIAAASHFVRRTARGKALPTTRLPYGSAVIICAGLVALLAIQLCWFDLRLAWRRQAGLPALRQNHPWWDSKEGRRMVARAKMSRAELIWIERDPEAFGFRMACEIAAVLWMYIVVIELVDRRRRRRDAGGAIAENRHTAATVQAGPSA